MKPIFVLRSAATVGIIAGAALALTAAPASASQVPTPSLPIAIDIGPSPVPLPQSCPFANGDANFVLLSGNVNAHDTSNGNGEWSGSTMEGTAEFYEGSTPLYQGHLTVWQGGGNNAQAQSEGGLTLDFHGTGPAGTLDIHVNFHSTTKAKAINGQPVTTANVQNVNISCS